MKKFTVVMLVAIISVLSFVLPVFAQNDEIKVFINGQEVEFDVEPQIINSRTMIPIRAVFEKMGATVDWDEETKTATCTKKDVVAKVTLGDNKIYQGDRIIQMDVVPTVIDSRILMPIRFAAMVFGSSVEWSPEKRYVVIATGGAYAHPDYPDIPNYAKCFKLSQLEEKEEDGYKIYKYEVSDAYNDEINIVRFYTSLRILGRYNEALAKEDAKMLYFSYTKPDETTPRFYIGTGIGSDGKAQALLIIPTK